MARQYICMEDGLSDVLFSDPFPEKRSDHESKNSRIRFDLRNPLKVIRFWIFVKKRKTRFRNQESGFGFSPKKPTLILIFVQFMTSFQTKEQSSFFLRAAQVTDDLVFYRSNRAVNLTKQKIIQIRFLPPPVSQLFPYRRYATIV